MSAGSRVGSHRAVGQARLRIAYGQGTVLGLEETSTTATTTNPYIAGNSAVDGPGKFRDPTAEGWVYNRSTLEVTGVHQVTGLHVGPLASDHGLDDSGVVHVLSGERKVFRQN